MPSGKGFYDPLYFLVLGKGENESVLAWRATNLSAKETSQRVCAAIHSMTNLPLVDLTAQAQQIVLGVPPAPVWGARG